MANPFTNDVYVADPIALSDIASGNGGFVINGQCAGDISGISAAAAGDVNGEGLDDLIVGAHRSDPAAGADAGRNYVIFGSTSGTNAASAVDQLGGAGDIAALTSGVISS
ncbi:MAG: integrin alpha [Candidatus Accumulibacter meliphilus]|jgi:hypothetical protein|uniref:integrin alpha n=1 Tax=Candidatus Accumulibacter meliphilus TaxID=2211374 RepID=UPI002FC37192